MSKNKKMAKNIYKKRQKILKEIKKAEKQKSEIEKDIVKKYVKIILKLFKISNKKEALFYELKIRISGKYLECVHCGKSKSGFVYNGNNTQIQSKERRKIVNAISEINQLEIETRYLGLIATYFESKLEEYFFVVRENSGSIVIGVKELSNCK